MRQEFFERHDLLDWRMTTIVNYDVKWRYFFPNSSPEFTIRLISNENVCPVVFISFARLFDVDAEYSTTWSKIFLPHIKASTTVYANFAKIYRSAPEFAEVAIVYFKIVPPLPNTTPFPMGLKVVLQNVLTISLCRICLRSLAAETTGVAVGKGITIE
jgi:hypothetical protein